MNKEKIRLEELNKKTCKDCYHYEKCYFEALKKSHLTGSDHREIVCIDNQIICKFFKDKSLIIELPCKVGKELFLTDYLMGHHRLKEYKFIGERVVMVIECFELQRTCKRFVDEHFGKTVFLTKEEAEAEAKLKELNNND